MRLGLLLSELFERHENPPGHPERPERLRAIAERLGAAGLLDACTPLEATQAPREALLTVHAEALIAAHERLHARGGGEIDPDTFVGPRSWPTALLAAGSALAAAEAVARGDVRRAFVALRPPGHHATTAQAMGFCLLNNIALAARRLLDAGHARRVLIVDFDVHHGNGTQEIFYRDPAVVFVSVHEENNYPHTGWPHETGAEAGEGTTFNRPFPAGTPPDVIRAALAAVLDEVRTRFAPDFVLVSAGFDGHRRDPLGHWLLEAADYAAITRHIVALAEATANGRVVSLLEGGYDLQGLADSVEAHVRGLLGD